MKGSDDDSERNDSTQGYYLHPIRQSKSGYEQEPDSERVL